MLPLPSRFLLVWLLALVWVPSWSQQLRFQRFGAQQGLAQNQVRGLAQDATGFLWAGTDDGLSRFDGLAFKSFFHRPGDSTSLPGNHVRHVLPTPDGCIWVATARGLACFDPTTGRFSQRRFHRAGQPDQRVNDFHHVFQDRRGRLWANTFQGIWRLDADGRHPRFYLPAPRTAGALPHHWILLDRHIEDAQGRLWVGTVKGLAIYDPATDRFWSHWLNPRGLACLADTFPITGVLHDRRGRVWYSSWGQGICRFDPTTGQRRQWLNDPRDPHSVPENVVLTLAEDREGTIWCGNSETGIARFDEATGHWQHFGPDPADPYSLPGHQVNNIFEDRQGNLWFGTDGGLAMLSPLTRPFTSWQAPTQPTGIGVFLAAVCRDGRGRIWVGSGTMGLLRFTPPPAGAPPGSAFRAMAAFPAPPYLAYGEVNAICPDPADGLLWVGTQAGIRRFDPDHEAWVPAPPELREVDQGQYPTVMDILIARDGALWLSTISYGVWRYDRRTRAVRHFFGPDPTGGDTLANGLRGMAEDAAGNIWLGATGGRGLSRIAAGTWRVKTWHEHDPDAPGDEEFPTMLGAADGGLWLGTIHNGLAYYDPARARFRAALGRADGLGANWLKSITADGHGRLWLGSINGLTLFDPTTRYVRAFGFEDGLPDLSFTPGSFYDARTGELWLTSPNYLVQVQTTRLARNPVPPPVALTAFRVNNRPATLPAAGANVTLPPGDNTLSFEFAALNLLNPALNRYSWRLEGADDRWSPASAQRAVTYANLPPGSYLLRVRAANNDGVWNQRGLTLHLILEPPWYRTWWFYLLATVAVAGLIYAFFRQRLERELALARTRDQIARDLHDDVGSTLSTILIQSQLPLAGAEAPDERLHKIGHYAQGMLDAMDDIVWTIDPRHDPLPTVVARMRAFAAEILEAHDIELTFRVEGALETVRLGANQRRHLYLLFKEAVHNAVKYSGANRVTVLVRLTRASLHLSVTDDGRGFDPTAPAQGSGNGLRNLRQRAALLHGHLTLDSAPGQGTQVKLEMPV